MCPRTTGALGVLTECPVLTFVKKSNTYFAVLALLAVPETQRWKEEPCVYDSTVSVTRKTCRNTSISIVFPLSRGITREQSETPEFTQILGFFATIVGMCKQKKV